MGVVSSPFLEIGLRVTGLKESNNEKLGWFLSFNETSYTGVAAASSILICLSIRDSFLLFSSFSSLCLVLYKFVL